MLEMRSLAGSKDQDTKHAIDPNMKIVQSMSSGTIKKHFRNFIFFYPLHMNVVNKRQPLVCLLK